MLLYLLSQLFGAASFAWGAYGFWHPGDRNFKIAFCISSVLMAAHYALLGAWVGVAICFVAAGRYFMASYTQSVWWMTFFIVLGMVSGHFTYLGPQSALPVLANIIASYAIFNLKGTQLRATMLAVSACWIAYNTYHISIIGVSQEVFYSAINILTIWRAARSTKHHLPVTPTSVPVAAHGGLGFRDRRKKLRD